MTLKVCIEVEGKDSFEFDAKLEAALAKLGFEPKPDADFARFHADLASALAERDLNAVTIVGAFRENRNKVFGLNKYGLPITA